MSKAMMAAIKGKRFGKDEPGDHGPMGHMNQHADDKSKDLHGFVASLSDDEKGKLKGILHADGKGTMGVEKGEPSSEEMEKIEESMEQENQANAQQMQKDDSRHPGALSDDVAEAMVDHKAMTAIDKGLKPRNLGERARMSAAQGLKHKGKI